MMLNFTVGPVQSGESVRKIGGEQVPYFRTQEFSNVMFENEKLIKKFAYARDEDRVVFITGSGTASMEAVVANTLTDKDKVLIVNGGSFGARFVELCQIYGVDYTEIRLKSGHMLKKEDLETYDNQHYTAFLVNVLETSTGVLYDLNLIHEFCEKNNLFLIVDAISPFLADDINMKKFNIDVMITGSQKALACPPGISVIVLSKKALERIDNNSPRCMYLNLKSALKNGERGQTPFTPAVGILLQIHERLLEIERNGGVKSEIARISTIADDFRSKIKDLPFEIVSESLSNAVTPLHPLDASANDIFLTLKDEYGIWVCPNGGDLKHLVFRVGHIGELNIKDNDKLINALKDMRERGLI
jgi:aspartate aminotransferase-like enzyme